MPESRSKMDRKAMGVSMASPVGVIRLAGEDDAAQILAIYAPIVRETVISFEFVPPPVEEIRRRITRTLERLPWIVCERDGEIRGYAYAASHRERDAYQWSADVSVYVASSSRRSGVGRALYTALLGILRLQGFVNAYAGITLPNPASVRLHESIGFQPVGIYHAVGWKFGAWHDVGWFELSLGERHPDPPPPRPIEEVRTWPEIASLVTTVP
jgi:L-amino acid N-acyltransferase YncA